MSHISKSKSYKLKLKQKNPLKLLSLFFIENYNTNDLTNSKQSCNFACPKFANVFSIRRGGGVGCVGVCAGREVGRLLIGDRDSLT